MNNPLSPKQYTGLMAGKKIMYIHGFMSSAQSGTVDILRRMLPDATIVAEDIPLHPAEAMAMLRDMAQREQPDLIIGTSMGGMYAEMLYGYDRILVNPAFEMGKSPSQSSMTGKQVYQNPRKDGEMEVVVTKALVKEYADITTHCFAAVTPDEQRRVFGLFGDCDPVVHTFDLFCSHYPQAIPFHGEHRLIERVVQHYLIPVVRWIDDRQEQRERPIVYLHTDTLADRYGHPASSMHKAYELLIERYNVYLVSPAPSNHPEAITATGAWITEHLSAPSWGHVVYTNQPHLLYGDFLVSPEPCPDFMGTTLHYGSDKFKTWEDLIEYFSLINNS